GEQQVAVGGKTDAAGVLRVALSPAERGQGRLRVDSLHVHQTGVARLPMSRWFLYIGFAAFGGLLGCWAAPGAAGTSLGLVAASALLAAGIWVIRLQALLFLPWMLLLLVLTLLLAGVASFGCRMPRRFAVVVCLVLL